MGVNSLPKTVTRQCRGCDLNPGPSAPESSTITTRLPSHPKRTRLHNVCDSKQKNRLQYPRHNVAFTELYSLDWWACISFISKKNYTIEMKLIQGHL